MRTTYFFIPIAGRIGAGKTTFANSLAFYFKQFSEITPHVISYADALRGELCDANVADGFAQLKDQEYKKKTIKELGRDVIIPKDFPCEVKDDTTVRQLMQWWGTEYRRAQNDNYWVNQMYDIIMSEISDSYEVSHAFICDDVRFPNELELFTHLTREHPNGKRMAIYLHHYGFNNQISMATNSFIPPNSLNGMNPSDTEHPSEFLLDVPSNCYKMMWDMVLSPSYRRIPTYALMAFDTIMESFYGD